MDDTTYFNIKKDDVFQLICALETQLNKDLEYIKKAAEQKGPFDVDDLVSLVEDLQATRRLMETAQELEKIVREETRKKLDKESNTTF
jgi:hypothetical protein